MVSLPLFSAWQTPGLLGQAKLAVTTTVASGVTSVLSVLQPEGQILAAHTGIAPAPVLQPDPKKLGSSLLKCARHFLPRLPGEPPPEQESSEFSRFIKSKIQAFSDFMVGLPPVAVIGVQHQASLVALPKVIGTWLPQMMASHQFRADWTGQLVRGAMELGISPDALSTLHPVDPAVVILGLTIPGSMITLGYKRWIDLKADVAERRDIYDALIPQDLSELRQCLVDFKKTDEASQTWWRSAAAFAGSLLPVQTTPNTIWMGEKFYKPLRELILGADVMTKGGTMTFSKFTTNSYFDVLKRISKLKSGLMLYKDVVRHYYHDDEHTGFFKRARALAKTVPVCALGEVLHALAAQFPDSPEWQENRQICQDIAQRLQVNYYRDLNYFSVEKPRGLHSPLEQIDLMMGATLWWIGGLLPDTRGKFLGWIAEVMNSLIFSTFIGTVKGTTGRNLGPLYVASFFSSVISGKNSAIINRVFASSLGLAILGRQANSIVGNVGQGLIAGAADAMTPEGKILLGWSLSLLTTFFWMKMFPEYVEGHLPQATTKTQTADAKSKT